MFIFSNAVIAEVLFITKKIIKLSTINNHLMYKLIKMLIIYWSLIKTDIDCFICVVVSLDSIVKISTSDNSFVFTHVASQSFVPLYKRYVHIESCDNIDKERTYFQTTFILLYYTKQIF